MELQQRRSKANANDSASSRTISASVPDGEGAGSLWKNMRAASAPALSSPKKKLEPDPEVKSEPEQESIRTGAGSSKDNHHCKDFVRQQQQQQQHSIQCIDVCTGWCVICAHDCIRAPCHDGDFRCKIAPACYRPPPKKPPPV